MGKHSHPDPRGVDALAEAVNEVLGPVVTEIVMDGGAPGDEDHFVAEMPQGAITLYEQVCDFVRQGGADASKMMFVASLREVAFALTFAVGMAVTHETQDRLARGWIECDECGHVVFTLCQLFVLAGNRRGQS